MSKVNNFSIQPVCYSIFLSITFFTCSDNPTNPPINIPAEPYTWSTLQYDFQRTGQAIVNGPKDGKIIWSALPDSNSYSIYTSPVISNDGTVFFGISCISGNGTFYAISSKGKIKWKYSVGDWIKSSPTLSKEGVIYFASWLGKVIALDTSGSLRWQCIIQDYFRFTCPILDSEGNIYLNSISAIYSFTSTGNLRWKYSLSGYANGAITSSKNNSIYVLTEDTLFALTLGGKLKWKTKIPTENSSFTNPAVAPDQTIYVSTNMGLCALDPNGTLKWNYETVSGIGPYASPIIGNDGNIFCVVEPKLLALSPKGELLWQKEFPVLWLSSPIISKDGIIYFGTSYSTFANFYALNTNGDILFSLQLKSGSNVVNVTSCPALASDGALYVGVAVWGGLVKIH